MWRNPPGILFCKMIRILVLLCMAILPHARCSKIHEHMSREERREVFHSIDESVPEYQVVPLYHSVHKRSPELYIKAFNKSHTLSLKANKGLWSGKDLPVYTVDRNGTRPDDLHYEKTAEESIGDVYQDQENMASVLVYYDADGKMLVDGHIGNDLVIRPIPQRVQRDVISNMKELHEPHLLPDEVRRTKRNVEQASHHIVYKKTIQHMDDDYSDFAFMEPDHIAKRFTRSKRSISSRSKRDAPYVIYPEILCIVDYDGYRLHGGDNVQIKRYFVSFWNGVDLRYKLLKGPKIRISIAGIIISRGRDATPYLERNRVGRDAIDSAAALTDMGKYLFRERRLPVYDIAVAVTKLDMCRRQYVNDNCNRGTAGFAYVGGACVVNKRLEKVNSVAIIEDTGGFSGIIVAAHEVGHLLGAVHDGSPPPSYLGGPGAEKCRWEDGFIMSDLRHTERGFKWSPCSVSSFHHFLNGDTATCLYNAPHEDEALPRVLPGKLLSLDAQCRKDRGTSACFKDNRVCAQLFCFDAGSGYCVAYRPAAEGSPCGDGQYCLNGKCVAENENIIPDYTQNIPTYVRREIMYNAATRSQPYYNTQYNTSTEYRYQWEETTTTTRSPYQSKYKYTTSYPITTAPTTTTTTTTTTTPPPPSPDYYETTQSPYAYYTPSTVNNFIPDDYYDGKYGFNYNNDVYNYNNAQTTTTTTTTEAPTTTTTRTTTSQRPYYYKYAYRSIDNDEANYPKVRPYVYEDNVSTTTTTTKRPVAAGISPSYAPPSYYGHETEADECQDVRTDCAEMIDRLRTWLCHLQSVRSRCCASLKTVC